MGSTFYVFDLKHRAELDTIIDEMEAEDVLEDPEDSAYDRFGALLERHALERLELSEDASEPAEAFFEWFLERVSHALDKLYLTPAEAATSLTKLEKLVEQKGGVDALAATFTPPNDLFSKECATGYLEGFIQILRKGIALNGLVAICYR